MQYGGIVYSKQNYIKVINYNKISVAYIGACTD